MRVSNFRCHSKYQIDFDQITTIVGPSDSGKTALLSALRWLCTGKPSGNRFVKKGKKESKVQLLLEDKTKITRVRGKSANYYKINEKELVAFASSIPTEIEKLLNISEQNFQAQFTMPFWFADTPGKISAELNKIVNLEKIDSTLQKGGKIVRQAKTELELSLERKKELEQEVKDLEWTENAANLVWEIQKLEKEKEALQEEIEEIIEIKEQIEKVKANITTLPDTNKEDNLVTAIRKRLKTICEIKKLQKEIKEQKAKIANVKESFTNVEQMMHQIMQERCPLCKREF